MTLYEMPTKSPYVTRFRIFAGLAISLLLVVSFVAAYASQELSHTTRLVLAWIASLVIGAAVVIGILLPAYDGLWKRNRTTQVELSDLRER